MTELWYFSLVINILRLEQDHLRYFRSFPGAARYSTVVPMAALLYCGLPQALEK
jgi:hypothetical protein